jgi:ribosomal protein L37AE/L43A
MELIIKNAKSVCPICSGVVHELIINTLYRCYDCRMLFQVTGAGYAESALKVKMEG